MAKRILPAKPKISVTRLTTRELAKLLQTTAPVIEELRDRNGLPDRPAELDRWLADIIPGLRRDIKQAKTAREARLFAWAHQKAVNARQALQAARRG